VSELEVVLCVMDLVEKIEIMLNDCPHSVDKATVPLREKRTPKWWEILREKQEVWNYSIGYRKIKEIRYLLRKLGSRELTELADKFKNDKEDK